MCERAVLRKNIVVLSADKSFVDKRSELGEYLIALKKDNSDENFCYEKNDKNFRLVKKGEFVSLEFKVSSLDFSSKVFSNTKDYKLVPQQYVYDYRKCRQLSQVIWFVNCFL